MATIGIVADTHVPQRLARLPHNLSAALRGVDLILHAGDLNSRQVLIELAEVAPVHAVAGNADLFGHGLPLTRLIEIEGKRIGLVHGHGGWLKYLLGKVRDRLDYHEGYYLDIVTRSFGAADTIVFGHTHRPHCEHRSGMLLFNPGPVAPTYYVTTRPQIGLLHVTTREIKPEIIEL